jgi:cytoskeleton protein RodZ
MPPANRNRSARQQRRQETGETPPEPPQQAVPVYKAHEPTSGQDVERIGDILRRRRQQRGDDLQQIADYLCIRKNFLVALENNDYDGLPADAYVIGFLRTYAAYLGFDGGDAINRYRAEMSGRRRKPALVLPTPITEGRTPSAFIMVGAAVVALLIYVTWYSLSGTSRTAANTDPALPPVTSANTNSQTSVNVPVAVAVPVAPATPPAPTAPIVTPASTVIPGGIALSSPPPNETGSSGAAPNQAALASTNAASHTKPAELAIPATPSPEAVSAQDTPPKDDEEESQSNAKVSDAAAETAATTQPAPANSRLVVRAEKESWVVITDAKSNTVLDRVMKPGDTFAVPDQPGLKLTTGNSGGIILVLDGKDLPKLSRNSSILHDISLDADKLGKAQKPVKAAKSKPEPKSEPGDTDE